jgi:3-hydroxyisobutyrate dehydrogenase-like beta-hydroxyacid dehydrogenase
VTISTVPLPDGARVAFCGLGRMGVRMAAHLTPRFDVVVWNRSRPPVEALVTQGASAALTPADAVRGADAVISMLADDAVVGQLGLAHMLDEGAVLVEMSTVAPATVRSERAVALARGADVVDAPVSGSVAFAEQRQLTTMVGGDDAAVQRVMPLLDAMTRLQTRTGGPGTGAAMKLAVNSVIAATNEAIAEALVLAERSGIDRRVAYGVMAESAVASPFLLYKRAAFEDPDAEPRAFTCRLLRKDVDLVLALARSVGAPMPQIATAGEVLTMAIGAGWGDADLNRVADLLRSLSSPDDPQRTTP